MQTTIEDNLETITVENMYGDNFKVQESRATTQSLWFKVGDHGMTIDKNQIVDLMDNLKEWVKTGTLTLPKKKIVKPRSVLMAFTLSMPNIGSWNGKWTGESNLYSIVKKVSMKDADKIINNNGKDWSYHYNFGYGWSANVNCTIITAKEKTIIKKKSKGFCGYEWMIDSIIQYQEIINSPEQKKRKDA